MTERIRTLPDAELAVMQAVWDCEAPAKRAQLAAILDKTHPMAPTTLLTVLSRLADKGFLRIEKTGRSAEYWPLVAREAYLARQGRKFYDTLCGGSLPAFAAALCASGLTAEELEELRELLREGTLGARRWRCGCCSGCCAAEFSRGSSGTAPSGSWQTGRVGKSMSGRASCPSAAIIICQ